MYVKIIVWTLNMLNGRILDVDPLSIGATVIRVLCNIRHLRRPFTKFPLVPIESGKKILVTLLRNDKSVTLKVILCQERMAANE
jgi:hypothetical protein